MKKGIWSLYVEGDWHGAEYEYEITVNGEKHIVNDPYTKALLPNSSKGVVVNSTALDHLDNSGKKPIIKNLQDSIIYELHVRDATVSNDSGVVQKGKFLGLTESGTVTSTGYSTGLSYLEELGVTHIQLLPINDFARVDELNPGQDYNWGYDPLYYQVPEGSYSCYPEDPLSRIDECKKMIEALHQEGLGVIIDVVYNHVYIWEESSFEKIVPGYYFRYFEDGSMSNGTGVGNDIATERKMVRKFILDTIDYWLKEFNVDGFRFDLMGIIDIDTLTEIQLRCNQESRPIMLLGEGWDLNTALPTERRATSFQSHQLPGIRFFNDFFRDTLKGNNFDVHDVGYVNGKGRFIERLPQLVSGSANEEFGQIFVGEVTQTVNYVECHDNHTLWDKLTLSNSHESIEDRKKNASISDRDYTIKSRGAFPTCRSGVVSYETGGREQLYIG
ncbi:MAG: type I pullulanase [Bacillus sp. (in: Bacteria)]|nr:type I pullulanase [Bacillus sp. (in: firmicutes)]